MPGSTSAFDIEIDAPDGEAAVALERRLAHLMPTSVGRGTDWIVEIPGPASPAEIEAVVRDWLADRGLASTSLRIEGRVLHVTAASPARPHLATNRQFAG